MRLWIRTITFKLWYDIDRGYAYPLQLSSSIARKTSPLAKLTTYRMIKSTISAILVCLRLVLLYTSILLLVNQASRVYDMLYAQEEQILLGFREFLHILWSDCPLLQWKKGELRNVSNDNYGNVNIIWIMCAHYHDDIYCINLRLFCTIRSTDTYSWAYVPWLSRAGWVGRW